MKKIVIIICLLLLGLLGFNNALAENNSQSSSGSELVSNILLFKAIPGDSHATLSWSNPNNSDFSGVVIQRSTENYVTTYDTGQNIYKGIESSYIDLNLTNGQTYYYSIFVYDSSGHYSSGAIAKATPQAPSLVNPYQEASKDYYDTNQGKPLVSSKKIEKVELTDFYYYLIVDKKILEIGLNDPSKLHVTNDSVILIEIPSDIFSKALNVITVSTDQASYLMKLIKDKNKYQVVIPAPPTGGDHELRFVAVYNDKSISDLKTNLEVDPRGYVYNMGSSFLGFGHKDEMRIEGAKVTIYQKNNNDWKVWNAGEYVQQNPQLTNSSGEYTFFVPKGEYRLEIYKKGYWPYKTDPFTLDNQLLNKKIEVKPWIDPRVCLAAVLIIILIFSYMLARRKKRSGKSAV